MIIKLLIKWLKEIFKIIYWGHSSVVEHLVGFENVAGSIPAVSIKLKHKLLK